MTNDDMLVHIEETIDLLRIFEKVDEIGDCLIWNGAGNGFGHPQFKSRARGRSVLVRRYVMELSGVKLDTKEPLACRCAERGCINPDHLYKSSNRAIAKAAARNGSYSSPIRARKIAMTKRKSSKLTMELAREIRMSTERNRVLAERYNVNPSLIQGIKAGKRWKDYSNPFEQLM